MADQWVRFSNAPTDSTRKTAGYYVTKDMSNGLVHFLERNFSVTKARSSAGSKVPFSKCPFLRFSNESLEISCRVPAEVFPQNKQILYWGNSSLLFAIRSGNIRQETGYDAFADYSRSALPEFVPYFSTLPSLLYYYKVFFSSPPFDTFVESNAQEHLLRIWRYGYYHGTIEHTYIAKGSNIDYSPSPLFKSTFLRLRGTTMGSYLFVRAKNFLSRKASRYFRVTCQAIFFKDLSLPFEMRVL